MSTRHSAASQHSHSSPVRISSPTASASSTTACPPSSRGAAHPLPGSAPLSVQPLTVQYPSTAGSPPPTAPLTLLGYSYSYCGTYLFLLGCLVFSFHSVLLLCEDGLSTANAVYFAGATLFTCGSVCYAIDAEQRSSSGGGERGRAR